MTSNSAERPDLPHLQSTPDTEAAWFQALADLARYLRGPDGCPWDREQTAASFAGYAHEEAQELVEAVERGDGPHTEEEWGDVLFVLLASAAAAESEGLFTLKNALRRAHEKMVRRHDHVFGEEKAADPQEALRRWEAMKQRERAARETGTD
jgi:uncharacterized protein YabN with tetrapyrrole methylase and pyrophosphatase domain